jgi:serine/threonine protein kinase
MPSPTCLDEFLDLILKSGVVEDKRLTAYVDKLRETATLPADHNQLSDLMVREGLLTRFQAEQFLLGKWRRFNIGKYKVLERLGSGGMGSVYLCEHKLMRRRVAVKVLPTQKAEDQAALERFYREARAVAALDHPNIVRAYDIDQDKDLHFLVMEYVDGASLQDIIKTVGAMEYVRAAHYMRQAALGLQHAHESANLVHRDVKPGNILVDRNGIVKILDMGLARFFHDEEDIITKKYDENVLGTADYLAPEQALDSHSVDIRADIYSLGATFYFTLTGRTPFAEGTVAQKLIWHQTRQPKAIRSIKAEVPQGLVEVIERMMAKDPGQRYQTPQAVADALEPWTLTPIPPPPDREMPQLSLAAMGAAPGEPNFTTGARNPSPGEPASAPSSHKQWQVGQQTGATPVPVFTAPAPPVVTPVRAVSPAPTVVEPPPAPKVPEVRPTAPRPAPARPAGGAARPAAGQQRQGAPPVVVPRKAAPPVVVPKAKNGRPAPNLPKLAPETEVAGSRGNTPPTSPRPNKPVKRRTSGEIPAPKKRPPKPSRLWLYVGAGAAAVAVLGLVIWLCV